MLNERILFSVEVLLWSAYYRSTKHITKYQKYARNKIGNQMVSIETTFMFMVHV